MFQRERMHGNMRRMHYWRIRARIDGPIQRDLQMHESDALDV